MAFADLLQHTMTVYPSANTQDASLGNVVGYGVARVTRTPCLLNAASADTQERFAQQGISVSHTIATSYAGVRQGDKIIAFDKAGTQIGVYHVHGLRTARQVGSIADFTYAHCEERLG